MIFRMIALLLVTVIASSSADAPHVAFPSVSGNTIMYRVGSGHNGIGDVPVVDLASGDELRRFASADYGGHDVRPGSIATVPGYGLVAPFREMWGDAKGLHNKAYLWIQRTDEIVPIPTIAQNDITYGKPFLHEGRLMLPMYHCECKAWPDYAWASILAWDGENWETYAEIRPPSDRYFVEPSIVKVSETHWVMALRTGFPGAHFDPTKPFENYFLTLGHSYDAGKTWALERKAMPGDGPKLFWDATTGMLYYGARWGGTVIYTSADGGYTWSEPAWIDRDGTGDCAYPDFDLAGPFIRVVWYTTLGQSVKTGLMPRMLRKAWLPIIWR